MGEKFLNWYKNSLGKNEKLAFYSAFILGLLIHIYKFVNFLPNHDSLYNFYSTQNIVGSGRWFLAIVCWPSSYFDLPWVIGFFSIILMALTVIVIVDIFDVSNQLLICIISGILVSFPSIVETFSFEFTADGYMWAMLLSALAVKITCIDKQNLIRTIMAAILICFTCGIYQAYVSFALVLALCYFIYSLLENVYSTRQKIYYIIYQVLLYSIGMVLYLIVWKVCLSIEKFQITDYCGINSLGQLNFISAIVRCISEFIKFFVEWNIFESGFTVYSILNIIFLVIFALTLIVAVVKSGLLKRHLDLILMVLALMSIPFAAFIWYFSSNEVEYGPRMMQSLAILYIFTGILAEKWFGLKVKDFIALILSLIILNNSVTANLYYYYMNLSYEKSYSFAEEVAIRIHLLDDGAVKNIAIIGYLPNYDDMDRLKPEKLRSLGILTNSGSSLDNYLCNTDKKLALFLCNVLDFKLSYYEENDVEIPYMQTNSDAPISNTWSVQFPLLSEEEETAISQTEEFRRMSVWPSKDSVKVIGDTIVIKLSETEED